MPIYGICTGTIVTSEIKQPVEGKPHHLIQVLQAPKGQKAELNSFKDDSLKAYYPVGAEFNALCRLSDYSFDGRTGQSAKIIENYTVSQKSEAPKKSNLV